jgi:hypothetical protein
MRYQTALRPDDALIVSRNAFDTAFGMSVISVSSNQRQTNQRQGCARELFQKEPLSGEGKSHLIISNRMSESSMA